jgi:hypothetical protein
MSEDNWEYLILAGILGIILLPILTQIKKDAINFYNSIIIFTKSNIFYIILLSCFAVLVLVGLYFIYKKIKYERKIKKEERKHIEELREKITELINLDISNLNSRNIVQVMNGLNELRNKASRHKRLDSLVDEITLKLLHCSRMYDSALIDERNDRAEIRKNKIKKETEEIKREKYIESLQEKEMDGVIYRRLDAEYKEVFIVERLRKEERKSLLKQGFNQSNQYFPDKDKIITVLVKKKMNHSDEHTFLVWYVQKLLKTYKGITNIREHDTKYPDVTFKHKGRYYAVEVETGTLSGHRKRLEKKINYLNSEFKGRWFVLVSNKNFLKFYKRFGPTTQRSQVTKMLENMLKIDHPLSVGVK